MTIKLARTELFLLQGDKLVKYWEWWLTPFPYSTSVSFFYLSCCPYHHFLRNYICWRGIIGWKIGYFGTWGGLLLHCNTDIPFLYPLLCRHRRIGCDTLLFSHLRYISSLLSLSLLDSSSDVDTYQYYSSCSRSSCLNTRLISPSSSPFLSPSLSTSDFSDLSALLLRALSYLSLIPSI